MDKVFVHQQGQDNNLANPEDAKCGKGNDDPGQDSPSPCSGSPIAPRNDYPDGHCDRRINDGSDYDNCAQKDRFEQRFQSRKDTDRQQGGHDIQ